MLFFAWGKIGQDLFGLGAGRRRPASSSVSATGARVGDDNHDGRRRLPMWLGRRAWRPPPSRAGALGAGCAGLRPFERRRPPAVKAAATINAKKGM